MKIPRVEGETKEQDIPENAILDKSTTLFLFKQNDTKLGEENLSDLNPSPQEETGFLCSYACVAVKNFKEVKSKSSLTQLVNVHLRTHHTCYGASLSHALSSSHNSEALPAPAITAGRPHSAPPRLPDRSVLS